LNSGGAGGSTTINHGIVGATGGTGTGNAGTSGEIVIIEYS
jgi:hypothetical protein